MKRRYQEQFPYLIILLC